MRRSIIAMACLLSLSAGAFAADVESISRLAAGPGNILFVADWKAAKVHAIELEPAPYKRAGAAFNVLDLEALLSRQVGGARVYVEDMGWCVRRRPRSMSPPATARRRRRRSSW